MEVIKRLLVKTNNRIKLSLEYLSTAGVCWTARALSVVYHSYNG